MKKAWLILFLFNCSCFFTQNKKTDSLWRVYNDKTQADTNRLQAVNDIAWSYRSDKPDTAIIFAGQQIELAQTLKNKLFEGRALNTMGVAYRRKGNYAAALKSLFTSLKIMQVLKEKEGIANAYNNIGLIYFGQGNYPEALKMYFTSLKIREASNDKHGIATCYNNIGSVYSNQRNYEPALKMYFSALKIRQEINDKQGMSSSYNSIGLIYNVQKNFAEALRNHFLALKLREEIKNKEGIGTSYNNIGIVYYNQGNYAKALENLFVALKMQEEIKDMSGVAASCGNIGISYIKLNKTKDAANYLNRELAIGKEIGNKEWIRSAYENLTILDSITGNYKAAFEHHKLYIIYLDSLNNEETQKKSMQASMQYEFDKKEIATKAAQEKLDLVTREEKQKQNTIMFAVAGVLLLVIIFSLFLFQRFRITRRQKKLIEAQKVLVDKAYNTLHEKNKEVMDSINYASRIQRALITSNKYIAAQLQRLKKNV